MRNGIKYSSFTLCLIVLSFAFLSTSSLQAQSADELVKMAGLSNSRGVTVADDTSPVDTMFRPMISFLAFSIRTQNCSLSD